MTPQLQMQAMLEKAGIPYKRIHCYGSQIMITARSEAAAKKWAALLAKFSTVGAIFKSRDENVDQASKFAANPSITKRAFYHDVWRVAATI